MNLFEKAFDEKEGYRKEEEGKKKLEKEKNSEKQRPESFRTNG